jgi:glycosyltransferase involved in cell wall biosynthesis
MTRPVLRILGTRGVPAAHGGFETFAECLALHLVARGWRVIVYCQEDGGGEVTQVIEDVWQGVERVRIPVHVGGVAGTIEFDWKATLHAARHAARHAAHTRDACLTLGYNTAVFCALLRWAGVPNLINMDGIEWSRAKWGPVAKAWFWLNERAGCWVGDHLVADHPEIRRHLSTRIRADKITTIPYGADEVRAADPALLQGLGVEPGRFLSVVARVEPENSLLEIVQGYSARPREARLLVLGRYDPAQRYHRAVLDAAGPDVVFAGAVYDKAVVQAIRLHGLAYLHGHQVGGTNPSLVEALGAGSAVIAHDNPFNRWVAGDGAAYFRSAEDCDAQLSQILADPARLEAMRRASRERFQQGLSWPDVLAQYEGLIEDLVQGRLNGRAERRRPA